MYKYEFIGWYRDTVENSDKVWGVIVLDDSDRWTYKYVTFWGRRGKKLQTKIDTSNAYDMRKLIQGKTRKGYNPVNLDKLHVVYPEFQSDLEKTAFWASLKA